MNYQVSVQHILDNMDNDVFKWVQMKDGEFRFCRNRTNHSSLVKENEEAISAGSFGIINGKYIRILSFGSMSLKLYNDSSDSEKIEKIFNLKVQT